MIPTFRPWTHTSDDSYIYQLSLVVATATVSLLLLLLLFLLLLLLLLLVLVVVVVVVVVVVLFERSEFLIATSKKNCACVRLILVLVGGRQTAIVVARYDSMIPGTYYVPDTSVPHFMIPGTYYVLVDTYVPHLPLYY